MGTEKFDLNASRGARDNALEQVTRVPWQDYAIHEFDLRCGALSLKSFIGEDIRKLLSTIEPPHHPNAWGALTRRLSETGRIVMLQGMRQMTAKRSKARQSPLWTLSKGWAQTRSKAQQQQVALEAREPSVEELI